MNIPPVVFDVLRVAAPTLLAALTGPLGGVAAAIATAALNKWLPPASTGTAVVVPPEAVVKAVKDNVNDPDFARALRMAELDLQKYQEELDFKFADLIVKDKQSSRDFQKDSGIAYPLMRWGMGIVVIAICSLLAVVLGSVLMIAGVVRITPETAQLAVGVFGLIGAITGYIASYGTQVLGFYYGSSAGSKDKDDALSDALQESGKQLGEAAASAARTAEVTAAKPPQVVVVPPTAPTPPTAPVPPVADWVTGPFGGVRWRVQPDGVLVEGETKPERTIGEPVTVQRIWKNYGMFIQAACAKHGVPAEIVVGVIATESRGVATAQLQEPDGRTSSGVMQLLTGTASEVLGRNVTAEDLHDPATNIEAGVAYIAKQKSATQFDPILVAAAYNAGGLYAPRSQDENRFRLRSTGDHLERMRKYYNDTVAVAKMDGWFAK